MDINTYDNDEKELEAEFEQFEEDFDGDSHRVIKLVKKEI